MEKAFRPIPLEPLACLVFRDLGEVLLQAQAALPEVEA